jgi:DNA-binding CsgD family transcriptional regulator
LTRAEEHVADLVVRGLSNKEIGHRLGISLHTVRTHLQATFRKVGVDSRTALAFEFLARRRSADRMLVEELLERVPGVIAVLGRRLVPVAVSERFATIAGIPVDVVRSLRLGELFPPALLAEERARGCFEDGRPRHGVPLAPGVAVSCIPLPRSGHVLLVEERG